MTDRPLFSLPFEEILRLAGERTAYAGGGAASAMACASAASLVAMSARFAGEWAHDAVTDAEHIVAELRELADADARSFDELLAAWRLPADEPDRRQRIAAAARGACAEPLRICQLGERVVGHALHLAADGKADLRGDAMAAAHLALAAVRAAAGLVQINARLGAATDLAEQAHGIEARTADLVDGAAM